MNELSALPVPETLHDGMKSAYNVSLSDIRASINHINYVALNFLLRFLIFITINMKHV